MVGVGDGVGVGVGRAGKVRLKFCFKTGSPVTLNVSVSLAWMPSKWKVTSLLLNVLFGGATVTR